MQLILGFALSLCAVSSVWAVDPYVEETLYFQYQKNILSPKATTKSFTGFSSFDQSLYVDALWDLVEDDNSTAINALNEINTLHYDLVQRLRVGILKLRYTKQKSLNADLVEELINLLRAPEADIKIIYIIAAYEADLLKAGHDDLINIAKTHEAFFDVALDKDTKKELTEEMVTDLFYQSPDVTTYMNGEYVKSVKIYMFCRENRIFPCLMTMRDAQGEVVRNEDGTIWTQAALASSKQGLPSYVRNGNTPTGILTIDSVMPYADQKLTFGKYRRMILNFIPKSKNEVLLKSLIPASSHSEDWWKESVTSRDIGRTLLRIHGTGKINQDATTPYFPFMRTSGCIAQRENTYDGVTFQDQRLLLDKIMFALGLEPKYENEVHVKGIIYLVNIDEREGAVTTDDLALRGIE